MKLVRARSDTSVRPRAPVRPLGTARSGRRRLDCRHRRGGSRRSPESTDRTATTATATSADYSVGAIAAADPDGTASAADPASGNALSDPTLASTGFDSVAEVVLAVVLVGTGGGLAVVSNSYRRRNRVE